MQAISRSAARRFAAAFCLAFCLPALSACAPKHAPGHMPGNMGGGAERAAASPPSFAASAQSAAPLGRLIEAPPGAALERAGQSRDLASGLAVLAGDRLRSGPQGPMQVLLEDGGILLLGPGTLLTLGESAPAAPGERLIIHMEAGLVRLTSGGAAGIRTAHARVDLGPGVVSVKVEAAGSTVYAEHAASPVLVNGKPLAQGYKITVAGRQ